MKLPSLFRARPKAEPRHVLAQVGNSIQIVDLNDPALAAYLRGGAASSSGAVVNDQSALKIAVAWRCVNLITGVFASLPLDAYRRVDERRRVPAVDTPVRQLLAKPNRWQTPGEWKRQRFAHLLLRGEAFNYKVMSRGRVLELWPLHPDRMEVTQNDDMSMRYVYTRKNGARVELPANEIVHWRGLSLDGVRALSVISYACEAMGIALSGTKAGATVLKRGQFRSGVFHTAQKLSDQGFDRLKAQTKESEGVNSEEAGGTFILEEGMEFQAVSLTAKDAQFLELLAFNRTDVGMFFGVPPHLYGDTDKSTSWGTGIVEQNTGFRQYTLQGWATVDEETIQRDLIDAESDVYVRYDFNGLLRADTTNRFRAYAIGLGSGGSQPIMTVNEVRALEDMEPRNEKWADELQPANTAAAKSQPEDDPQNDPPAKPKRQPKDNEA